VSRLLRSAVMLLLVAVGVSALVGVAQGGRCELPTGQAIQFGIGSSFRLGTFEGTTISYQRFIGDRVAWRLGLSIDADYRATEYEETAVGDIEMDGSIDLTDWDSSFSAVSEWLLYRGSVVSVYLGGGPRVSYSARQDEYARFFPDEDESWRADRTRGTSLGVGASGVIGVQWAAADWVALHAEYRVNAMYMHETFERTIAEGGSDNYIRETTDTVNRFALDSTGVRFGLSVYF
jgi:hypothetical protein